MPGLTDQLFDCQVLHRALPAEDHLSARVVLEQQIEFFLTALEMGAPEWPGPDGTGSLYITRSITNHPRNQQFPRTCRGSL